MDAAWGWYPDRVLRLFDRRKGRFGGLKVHERVVISDGSTGVIDGYLVHATYRNVSQYIRKQDLYTGISAEECVKRGRRLGPVSGVELLLRPLIKFVQVYLLKRGFLDGMHGWIVAVGASYFNFFKYAKVWEAGLAPDPIVDGGGTAHASAPGGLDGSSIHGRLRRLDTETQARAESTDRLAGVGWVDVAVRPLLTFMNACLCRQACRRGLRGLVDATLMSFSTFVRSVKAWELLMSRERSLE